MLLIIEAINHYRLIKAHQEFKYRLAYTYVIGAAFWNFVGAGVFGGGTLNAPLVNYYEHGTFLTLNHAHTALFGAFGELAIGLIYFCLRYIHAERARSARSSGCGPSGSTMAAWCCGSCSTSSRSAGRSSTRCIEHGLAYARSSAFYNTTLFWQWMRLPGDVVFAVGALLMAWDFIVKLRPLYPRAVVRIEGAHRPELAE